MRRISKALKSLALVLIMAAVVGCGAESPFEDGCKVELELDHVSYTDVGFSTRATARAGTAQIRACAADSDTGEVKVLSFDAYPRSEVIGVRDEDDKIRVFFADTLSDERRQQILGERLLNAGSQ